MAELVDAPVSGTGGATHGSSSLLMPTTLRTRLRVAGHETFAQGYGWQAFVFVLGKVAIVKESFGVVAQLIERYVRIVEVVGLSPISSTKVVGFACTDVRVLQVRGIWRNGRR